MDKILIVDGSNLLFQMFYGMPARIVNSQGKAIHGTLGFVGALLKIVHMTDPTHVAVLFDGECTNKRVDLDRDYKANRPDYSQLPQEDLPFSQLPDIYAALDLLHISHRETDLCEADDWIAGYVKKYSAITEMVIVSQDSDFFQLISDNVRILRYRGEKTVICGNEWLWNKFEIRPRQYADFKSLVGDRADNIPGVHGVGPKTAAALLSQFGSLKQLLIETEKISGAALRNAIEENKQRLILNRELIQLDGDVLLPFTLDQIRWSWNGMRTSDVLNALNLR